MKRIIFAIGAIAATAIGLTAIIEMEIDGRKCLKDETIKKRMNERSKEDKEAFDILKKCEHQKGERDLRESSEINQRTEQYKKDVDYYNRRKTILENVEKKVNDFKATSNYSDELELINKAHENRVEEFKDSHKIDEQIKEFEKSITEAEQQAREQKLMIDIATDDSEFGKISNEKLSASIEETESKIRKKAKKAIKEVKQELKDFEKASAQTRDEAIEKLNKKVNTVRESATKDADAELDILSKDLREKTQQIREDVLSKRTEEEKSLEDQIKLYSQRVDLIKETENLDVDEKLMKSTRSDWYAAYFRSKGFGKVEACIILSLPALPVIFIGAKYVLFVREVIKNV